MPKHQLFIGESCQILRGFKTDSFDVACTDPPYSSATAGGFKAPTKTKYTSTQCNNKFATFAGDSRDQRAFQLWVSIWAGELFRIIRPGGALLTFVDHRNLAAKIDAVQAAGWTYQGVLPWIKKTSRPRKGWFRISAVEYIVLGSKGKQNENAYGPHYLKHQPPTDRKHPTEKPVELIKQLLEWRTDWKNILDPFAGSGTVFAAAQSLGRTATAIEISPEYAAIAAKRAPKITVTKPRKR